MKFSIILFFLSTPLTLFAQNVSKLYETKVFIEDSLFVPTDLAYIEGWLFTKSEGAEYGIKIFNAKTGEFEYELGRQGRGPAEYTNNFTIQKGPDNNTLEVSDSGNRKNDIYNIDCLKSKPSKDRAYTCILSSVKNIASRQALVLDEKLVVNHSSTPEGILFLSKGETKMNYLDTIPEEINLSYKKPIHRAFAMTGRMAANSERTAFAYFADSFDRILFYEREEQQIELVKEQKYSFLPQFKVHDFGASSYMEPSDEYRGAFYSPVVSDHMYYVIYSGKSLEDVSNQKDMEVAEWRGHSSKIQIYDFNGVKNDEFTLDKEVFIIEVNNEGTVLFSIHFDGRNYSILRSTLK